MGLFALFKPAAQEVPGLGRLDHRRGAWRSTIALGGARPVPLELADPRGGVPEAIAELARQQIVPCPHAPRKPEDWSTRGGHVNHRVGTCEAVETR
jgi:hypothetical protein